jgi:hypothetical protein
VLGMWPLRMFLALPALALALPGCFRGGAELSPSGKGLPQVTVAFPNHTAPGSIHRARLQVRNPGPGAIARVVVSFALVGAPAAEGLPTPLVDASGRGGRSVMEVSPRPTSVSPDGVVYRFDELPEGGSLAIDFRLRVPRRPGAAANSVTVYDDVDPTRARGVLLKTQVGGSRAE